MILVLMWMSLMKSVQPPLRLETPSKPPPVSNLHVGGPSRPPQFGRPNVQGSMTRNHQGPQFSKPPQHVAQPLRSIEQPHQENHAKNQGPPRNIPGMSALPPTPQVTPNRPNEPAGPALASKPDEKLITFQKPNNKPGPPANPANPPVGFFTGRAAFNMDENTVLSSDKSPAFDPHRPTTIPRSAGIDHSKSSPIPKKIIQPNQMARPNFENPSANITRQIGMPPGRSAYRPPSIALSGMNGGVKRSLDSGNANRSTTGPDPGLHLNLPPQLGGNSIKRPKT
ncbi:hypothetical protein EX30DRAFT_60651 [Ascodesmis nigricans]|uniref:Uncharacterized protein n=1 Tax=Ascodesmis nigricans TaxID=341454 RepID=A0A4S2MVB2_9PEZI|nr:hypothetical protein EX30DRAFT_60651 [Ascodesmis nigricans]